MSFPMLGLRHQLQVVDVVVVFIAVDVMHDFRAMQAAAKMRFHHQPVLVLIATAAHIIHQVAVALDLA